jgi:uncharacterized RDD family membrane protein YckC
MSVDNPYASPRAELFDVPPWEKRQAELAGRWIRFAAAFIDGLIGLGASLPIMHVFGVWDHISKNQEPPMGLMITVSAINFAVFLLLHGYFLKTNGQTIGKKLLGIRIADLDGGVPPIGRLILCRILPVSLVSFIPVVGRFLPLVDVLFIFRSDRRCIHDLLAGTRVLVDDRVP